MIERDELLRTGDEQRIWQKYCGFFDLSLSEFMEIQEQLLAEQIELVAGSELARKFMPEKPRSIAEFRQTVPLTRYEDYMPYLVEKDESALATKPYFWAHTSGRGGNFKWVPYTLPMVERFACFSIGLMILACTSKKGEVNVREGFRVLQNLPPTPYLTGHIGEVVSQKLNLRYIPPLEKQKGQADFQRGVEESFQMALRTGVDMLGSLTTILVKIGERFSENSGKMKLSIKMLHPRVMARLASGYLRALRERRKLLPKDLWMIKGLAGYGTDTEIYRDQLIHYWGRTPLENYASTETGLVAAHAWNKRYLTFVPFFCFLEFIPEVEYTRSLQDSNYRPATVLLNEVQPRQRYEIVISSFYGMPFLRYRVGDLIRIVAMEDDEAGIKLPQMAFVSRVDGLIDLGGFTRLDERTIWKTIANTNVKYVDWSARKEYEAGKPVLIIYLEPKETVDAGELERALHKELLSLSKDYSDFNAMINTVSMRLVVVDKGSFDRYYQERRKAGADLAHLKPPHMNASDSAIEDLLGKRVEVKA